MFWVFYSKESHSKQMNWILIQVCVSTWMMISGWYSCKSYQFLFYLNLNLFRLNYIPQDSEDVRTFMNYSIHEQNHFYFNIVQRFNIQGSKYIDSLITVAKKTHDLFAIYYSIYKIIFK